jgi:5-methylcytosine-specific restriction endonuclease McrA
MTTEKEKARNREYQKNYYATHPEYQEKVKAKARAWALAHKDLMKEKARKWQYDNYHADIDKARLKVKKSHRKRRVNDPITVHQLDIVYKHARRARKRKSGETFTAWQWFELCNHYGWKCLCCGNTIIVLQLLGDTLTPDHVIPLSKDGPNNISNIQPLCKSCNSKKGTKCTDYRK